MDPVTRRASGPGSPWSGPTGGGARTGQPGAVTWISISDQGRPLTGGRHHARRNVPSNAPSERWRYSKATRAARRRSRERRGTQRAWCGGAARTDTGEEPPPEGTRLVMVTLRTRGLRGGHHLTTGRHPVFRTPPDLTGPGRHRAQTTAGPAADSRRRPLAGPRRGETLGRARRAGSRMPRWARGDADPGDHAPRCDTLEYPRDGPPV